MIEFAPEPSPALSPRPVGRGASRAVGAESLASDFELWCESQGISPRTPLAWESYCYLVDSADAGR